MQPAGVMDPERRAIELQRARSATMWKVIATASAATALAIAIITTLRDDRATSHRDASDETQEPGGVETAGTARAGTPVPVGPQTGTVVDPSATSAGADDAANGGPTSTTTTTSASAAIDTGRETSGNAGAADAAVGRDLAAPAVVATAPPAVSVAAPGSAPVAEASSDAGTGTGSVSDAGTTNGYEEPGREASAPDGGGAGAARDPWAPPSMSAGAGAFSTQAPYWGASAWVPNPNAGAGRFATEAPPWSASAFTSDPNAGAGPFTTESNIPAYGVWPYWPWVTTAPR